MSVPEAIEAFNRHRADYASGPQTELVVLAEYAERVHRALHGSDAIERIIAGAVLQAMASQHEVGVAKPSVSRIIADIYEALEGQA